MPVNGNLPPQTIKYKGLFDFTQFIKTIRGWYGAGNFHLVEKKYKWKPGELEVEMEGDTKYNEYFKYKIKVWIRSWDIKDVDVVKGGEKIKMQEGRLAIEVNGSYDLDYQNRFEGSKFLQGLRDFYHKYIIKQVIDDWYEDVALGKIFDLTGLIKEKLQFEENMVK